MMYEDWTYDPDAAAMSMTTGLPAASLFGANGYHFADPSQMTTLTGQNRGGSNAWLWQPTETNTAYNPYQFGGQNNYMTGEVARYLRALGYQGNTPEGGNISADDATALNQFLGQHGLSVQTGTHQVPGYSQNTGIQRIIDSNGNPVAVDARNNRYDGNDRLTDIGKAAALAAGAYYAFGGIPGLGEATAAGGTGAGAGTSTLGAGATGAGSAGLTASLPSSAELLGGLSSSSSLFTPMAYAPTLGAGAGLTAGIGAADLGGLSSAGLEASGWAAPISGAQSSAGLGSFGTLGAGATAPSVTTPGIGAADTAGIGLSNTAPLTGVPSTAGAGGLLGSIANSGVGQAVGQVADLVGGGSNLAAIIGGIAGATQGGGNNTATRQTRTDPRFDAYLYGTGPGDTNSLLGAAQQFWQQNRSGLNPTMQAALDMQRSVLQDPAYAQSYTNMRDVGSGLLGRQVAGNPFTMANPPQFGRNAPAMPQAQTNPFMGLFSQTQQQQSQQAPEGAGLLNPFRRIGG